MASFEVKVRAIQEIGNHPWADVLDICRIDGYQFVVRRDRFKVGSLGVYIPEGGLVPQYIIDDMEVKLGGPKNNVVKAIKLRGQLSQGLFWHPDQGNGGDLNDSLESLIIPTNQGDFLVAQEGDDVAVACGITKYEPPIPVSLSGIVEAAPGGIWRSYDVENWKKYPHILQESHLVSFTEKLHGSCLILYANQEGRIAVSSKGVAANGQALIETPVNSYWRAVREFGLIDKLRKVLEYTGAEEVMLFGELLGVQDLMYGLAPGKLDFRAFDVYIKSPNDYSPFFLWPLVFQQICDMTDIPTVPVLYEGPFSVAEMERYTDGQSTIAGHIREGIVIKPIYEFRDSEIGRVVLKNVSGDYLTRKNATEFN